MDSQTTIAIVFGIAIVAGAYALHAYQAGLAKERAAKQWGTLLDIGTAVIGL